MWFGKNQLGGNYLVNNVLPQVLLEFDEFQDGRYRGAAALLRGLSDVLGHDVGTGEKGSDRDQPIRETKNATVPTRMWFTQQQRTPPEQPERIGRKYRSTRPVFEPNVGLLEHAQGA